MVVEIKDAEGVKRAHRALKEGGEVERRVAPGKTEPVRPLTAALLWDGSFLWGLFCRSALKRLGFFFRAVRAVEIRDGCLDDFDLLIAPGGFASQKAEALGEKGGEAVKDFIKNGGGYLGFCGGAGLGLSVEDGLGLLPARRKPQHRRLPNISGGIMVRAGDRGHPLWSGLGSPSEVKVWWPSQFEVLDARKLSVAARYGEPAEDFYTADIMVSQIEDPDNGFGELEESYGINLDPVRIEGEPAVLTGSFGRGGVALSYPHLDTPEDGPWAVMLFNLWQYAGREGRGIHEPPTESEERPPRDENADRVARGLFKSTRELIALGEELNLWSFRNNWLMAWRRGVRGFEFNVLYVMSRELVSLLEAGCPAGARENLLAAEETLGGFFKDAKEVISSGESEGFGELFGPFPASRGEFMDAIRSLDRTIFELIREPGPGEFG